MGQSNRLRAKTSGIQFTANTLWGSFRFLGLSTKAFLSELNQCATTQPWISTRGLLELSLSLFIK
jgi:hypothetical protein